jgi:hypothetical protein
MFSSTPKELSKKSQVGDLKTVLSDSEADWEWESLLVALAVSLAEAASIRELRREVGGVSKARNWARVELRGGE